MYNLFYFQFLLLMMGVKAATSQFACIWCKNHKHSRLVRKVIVYTINVRKKFDKILKTKNGICNNALRHRMFVFVERI